MLGGYGTLLKCRKEYLISCYVPNSWKFFKGAYINAFGNKTLYSGLGINFSIC